MITNILDLSIWRLRFKQLHQYKYSKRNNLNKGFHYNPLSFPSKFRFVEISPMRILALAKFRQNKISLQWMRNFTEIRAKFRLTQRKFASALTKLCRIFARTKNEKHRISTVCISFSTILYKGTYLVRPSNQGNEIFGCRMYDVKNLF